MTLWPASLLLLAAASAIDWDEVVPLDDYVFGDDGVFGWTALETFEYENCKIYMVNMTSQRWFDESFSDRPVWWHVMGIGIPNDIRFLDGAFLYMDGGSNRGTGYPDYNNSDNRALAGIVSTTGIIGAYLRQVPNQPIVFVDDEEQRPRTEDAQIAFTWRMFLEGGAQTPEMLSRFPMTKAGKHGLDTITQVAKLHRPETDVTRFAAAGGSKRGWAAWTLAAVDRRVEVAFPIVMSLLNQRECLMQHFRSLGGWSFAFADYYEANITAYLSEPILDNLTYHVDPFSYKERLDGIPKVHVSATGDEFFLNSDSHSWFAEMGDRMWMMMNPNTDHPLIGKRQQVAQMIGSAFTAHLKGDPWPKLNWVRETTETGGFITMCTDTQPASVKAFHGTTFSKIRRDFRWLSGSPPLPNPIIWYSDSVEDLGENCFRYSMDLVEDKWRGFFIEATWPAYNGYNFTLTTEVHIVPDTLPFDACETPAECRGSLV